MKRKTLYTILVAAAIIFLSPKIKAGYKNYKKSVTLPHKDSAVYFGKEISLCGDINDSPEAKYIRVVRYIPKSSMLMSTKELIGNFTLKKSWYDEEYHTYEKNIEQERGIPKKIMKETHSLNTFRSNSNHWSYNYKKKMYQD